MGEFPDEDADWGNPPPRPDWLAIIAIALIFVPALIWWALA